jgi:hypothetical protein
MSEEIIVYQVCRKTYGGFCARQPFAIIRGRTTNYAAIEP